MAVFVEGGGGCWGSRVCLCKWHRRYRVTGVRSTNEFTYPHFVKWEEQEHIQHKVIFSSVRFKAVYHTQESQSIDRVLGFFSSRPNWDPPPTPSPTGECVPLFGSGGHARLRERGWGFPIRMRGQALWYSRYIIPLWLCTIIFCESLELWTFTLFTSNEVQYF